HQADREQGSQSGEGHEKRSGPVGVSQLLSLSGQEANQKGVGRGEEARLSGPQRACAPAPPSGWKSKLEGPLRPFRHPIDDPQVPLRPLPPSCVVSSGKLTAGAQARRYYMTVYDSAAP